MGRIPPVVGTLVAINVVVFALGLLQPELAAWMNARFALSFLLNAKFAWWQFATSLFLHGGITHIAFNMFALVSFGQVLEQLWGTRRFLTFYLLCGVGAGLIFAAVNWFQFQALHGELLEAGVSQSTLTALLKTGYYTPDLYTPAINEGLVNLYRLYAAPCVGASGAIYGVLVAFGLTYPNARLMLLFLPVPVAAKYIIPALLALDLLGGVTGFSLFGGHIAHFAHIGGATIGFLLMWYWRRVMRRRAAHPPMPRI